MAGQFGPAPWGGRRRGNGRRRGRPTKPFPETAEEDDILRLTALNWGLGSPANGFLQPLVTMLADVVQGYPDDPEPAVVEHLRERRRRQVQASRERARTREQRRQQQIEEARTYLREERFRGWLAWTVERNAATRVGQPPPPVPCCPGFRADSVGLCWNCGEWEHEHPHMHYGPLPPEGDDDDDDDDGETAGPR